MKNKMEKKSVYPSRELRKAWNEIRKWQRTHGKISLSDTVIRLKK